MNSESLVTIAIPTYNRSENYFRQSLESVLNQTYKNLEVIVADNASTTFDVEAVVKSYGDERIKYHRHETNIGLVENWNWCVREASGEWVNIFHDDDVMMPDNVSNMIGAARHHPQANLHFTEVVLIDDDGEELNAPPWTIDIPKGKLYPGRFAIEYLFSSFQNRICAPSVFVKREFYLEKIPFSRSPIYTTDLNMWLKLLSSPRAFFVVGEAAGIRYRIHSQQATVNYIAHEQKCLFIEFGRIFPSLSLQHKLSYLKKFSRRLISYTARRARHTTDLVRGSK